MKANPDYEAGFRKDVDDDRLAPQELSRLEARRGRNVKIAIGLALVALVAGAGGGVLALRRDTPAKQFARAKEQAAKNRHGAAIVDLKRSLQGDPDQPAARYLLGVELANLGDQKGAEIEFQKAANANYDPEHTTPRLVAVLLAQGKLDKVVATVNNATIESPEANADLMAALGSAYYALGNEEAAKNAWAAAMDFVPGHPGVLMAQANALATAGKYDEARSILDRIPANATKQAEIQALRGDIARAQDKPADAVTAYEASLQADNASSVVRAKLAQAYVDLRQFDLAQKEVDSVLSVTPNNPKMLFLKAMLAYVRGDYPVAYEAITKSTQLVPTDGRGQLLAGSVALKLDQLIEAEQHLRDAVRILPNAVEPRRLLASLYVQRHEPSKADAVLAPLFASMPEDQEIAKIAADISLMRGDVVKASKAFDRVDASKPEDLDSTLASAALKVRAGDRAGAFARLRAAAIADPANGDIDTAIVLTYLQLHQLAEARAAWVAADAKHPEQARNYDLLSSIDLARNDEAAARRSLEKAISLDSHLFLPVGNLASLDAKEGKSDAAKERLRAFIIANPGSTDAIMLLVQMEDSYPGKDDPIPGLLRDARKSGPQSIGVVQAQVAYYRKHGDPKQALAMAEEGLRIAPSDFDLLSTVADLAYQAGKLDRSIAALTRLTALNAENSVYPARLGGVLLAAGQPEAALASFNNAVDRHPESLGLQVSLVDTLLAAGRGEEAGRLLFEIVRVAPKSPAVDELDADVKLAQKQYPDAIAAYRKLLALTPTSAIAIKTYNALTAARQRGEAMAFLAGWVRSHPDDPAIRGLDADVALRAQDFPRAIVDLRLVASAHPNDAAVLNNLAWALSQVKDPQALATAEKASTLAPDNAAITDTFGWMLVGQGQAQRGLGLIAKASAAAPKQLDIRLHLARAQLASGQKDEARRTLRALVETAPQSAEGKASQDLLATW